MSNAKRIAAFDNLRAGLTLLGIVIHSGLTYCCHDFGSDWTIKNKATFIGFDLLVDFIHTFRMPLFFVISGYFSAQLFTRNGAVDMIKNRIYRIALPFIVFLIILLPLTGYSLACFKTLSAGWPQPFTKAYMLIRNSSTKGGIVTIHLWFLYYLFIYAVIAAIITSGYKKYIRLEFRLAASAITASMFKSKFALFLFPMLTFLCFICMNSFTVHTSVSFTINLAIFLTYGLFFYFGWQLLIEDLLYTLLRRNYTWLLLLAFVFYFTKIALLAVQLPKISYAYQLVLAGLNALAIWGFIWGFLGLFYNKLNRFSKFNSAISDAAYWIYIIHLPIVIFTQAFVSRMDLPAFVKFSFVMLVTTVVSYSSYRLFVKNTFIGRFLGVVKVNYSNEQVSS